MRVFLFGLFLRYINLLNLKSEPVQLVLSKLIFIALIDASDYACMCLCSWHDFRHMPSNWIYRYMYDCLCTPLDLILRTRWVVSWQS